MSGKIVKTRRVLRRASGPSATQITFLHVPKAGQRNRLKSKGLSTLGTIDCADWADYADIAFSATGVYDLFNLFQLRHLGFLAKSSEGDS